MRTSRSRSNVSKTITLGDVLQISRLSLCNGGNRVQHRSISAAAASTLPVASRTPKPHHQSVDLSRSSRMRSGPSCQTLVQPFWDIDSLGTTVPRIRDASEGADQSRPLDAIHAFCANERVVPGSLKLSQIDGYKTG